MASWLTIPPTIPFDPRHQGVWWDYFTRQQAFMQNLAKTNESQTFTGKQTFSYGGGVQSGGILLKNNYNTLVDIQKSSDAAKDAASGGGNAALYIQHYINGSTATIGNVNSGIRSQIETMQKRSDPNLTNDVVAGYFGVRNRGVDVGAFGTHIDAYSFGTGANTTMYGSSVEMYRENTVGITVAFHARSIDDPLNPTHFFDNDFGFLCSPSPGGVRRFASCFAAGSSFSGTMKCDFGLDLRQCDAAAAIISIPENSFFTWNGNASADVKTRYEGVGRLAHYVGGVFTFGIENTGRLFIVNNTNTVVATAFVPSGDSLVVNIGGVLRKIQLGVFP